MTAGPSDQTPSTATEVHEAFLKRLCKAGAPKQKIGEVALACLEHLLSIEHVQLAAIHVCEHEVFWDDEQRLAVLELMQQHGAESHTRTLCHRWKLSEMYRSRRPLLFQELFPKL